MPTENKSIFKIARNIESRTKELQRKLNRAETEYQRDKIRVQIKQLQSQTVKSLKDINELAAKSG